MSLDWDIDSYKSEHESEEHWELRKKFMLAHKNKFPEDELVCLAQVFTNIEFMGCRYPDKTMIRVAELAKGVVEKYREGRKNSLKRTFVAASDAASAKVKGQSTKSEEARPPKKAKRNNLMTSETDESYDQYSSQNQTNNIVHDSEDKLKGPLGEFVLIIPEIEDRPLNVLVTSVNINKSVLKWDIEDKGALTKVCKLYINNKFICEGSGSNRKACKENSASIGLEKLKESHYSIKLKGNTRASFDITAKSHLNLPQSNNSYKELEENNVGMKLMKLMGWQGKGLGSHEQGILEPVKVTRQNFERSGFGQKPGIEKSFLKCARNYIKKWMKDNFDRDLVFSSEFTSDERKELHRIASQLSLKSRSYGKEENRQLVISRKIEPWGIIEELKKMGGSSVKYELVYPTKAKASLD